MNLIYKIQEILISFVLLLIIIIKIKNVFISKRNSRISKNKKKVFSELKNNFADNEKKFLYFFLEGREEFLNEEKYAEELLLRNSIECINFFKKIDFFKDNLKKKTFFFTNQSDPSNKQNKNLHSEFKNALDNLQRGELERVDYVYLSGFHWTSGYIVLIDNKFEFYNYNSIGNSIPIRNKENLKNFIKKNNINYFNKELSLISNSDLEGGFEDANGDQNNDNGVIKNPQFEAIKSTNVDFAAQQKDGNFCGYCSIFNLEKEFFRQINVIYNSEKYESFKKQMYYSLFFLNNFYNSENEINRKIFDQNAHVLNYNFEQIKNSVNLKNVNLNEFLSLNTYSRYVEFIKSGKNYNVYIFIQNLQFIVKQDNNIDGQRIIHDLEDKIQQEFKKIVFENQEIKEKAKKIFDFIADHNKKISDNIEFGSAEQLKKFVNLKLEYQKVKLNQMKKFFENIIEISKEKIIKTKQKNIQMSFDYLKKVDFIEDENLYNQKVYGEQENEINISDHLNVLLNNFTNDKDFEFDFVNDLENKSMLLT